MTPADLAKAAALPFECKKDSMRQNQDGTWKITFTVQAVDVPRRLTEAMPGTRYQAVIVEINDVEMPVLDPAEEVMPDTPDSTLVDARPEPELNPPARAKPPIDLTARHWRDMAPAQQAGIRCNEPEFGAFLREERRYDWREVGASASPVADCVRLICGVDSRKDLNTDHRARVIWHQLDEQFQTWKALERAS